MGVERSRRAAAQAELAILVLDGSAPWSGEDEQALEAASAAVTPEELGLLDHVAALPESQRTVLHLHYYEGYTLREIARLLGVTVPTVKMRLKRGRDALRNTWEESL